MNNDITLWGIHAGRTGDAESMFLDKKVITLGWSEVGNLNSRRHQFVTHCVTNSTSIAFQLFLKAKKNFSIAPT